MKNYRIESCAMTDKDYFMMEYSKMLPYARAKYEAFKIQKRRIQRELQEMADKK